MDANASCALPSIVGIRQAERSVWIMTQKLLDPAIFSLHLTSSGYVTIDSGQLDSFAELAMFGPSGPVPPQSLLALTQSLLDNINAAPDPSDAADLRLFAKSLKASLAQVETTLAALEATRLEQASD